MAESRREEQKLWLILFQINAIRTRLNLLAIQYWIFATLAVLVALAALIFYGSLLLPPLVFLGVTLLGLGLAAWELWRVIAATRRRWASSYRAAALADTRAALKGRLATILSVSKTAAVSSPLWPHLLEDTYLRRQTFEPRHIEARWVSRAILALGAVCAAVALFPFAASLPGRIHGPAAIVRPASISADIDNLSVEPADPGEAANTRVYADTATLKRLESKLAAAQKSASNDSALKRWMNRARNFAGDLQDRVARRNPLAFPPLDLHLHGGANSTAPNGGNSQTQDSELAENSSNSTRPGSAFSQGPASANSGEKPPRVNLPADQADQLAGSTAGLPPAADSGQTEAGQGDPGTYGGPTLDGGNGSMHSGGTDPAHLFGPPTPEQLGSDNFKIAVDAAPSDEASTPGATAYIPPEVRVPLNPEQAPDQPLARAAIPAADQAIIKRVFER